jgi:hypothetical protein
VKLFALVLVCLVLLAGGSGHVGNRSAGIVQYRNSYALSILLSAVILETRGTHVADSVSLANRTRRPHMESNTVGIVGDYCHRLQIGNGDSNVRSLRCH